MTRKSERELERALDRLTAERDGHDPAPLAVYRDPETDALYADPEGTDPVDPDEVDPIAILPTDDELVRLAEEVEADREGVR